MVVCRVDANLAEIKWPRVHGAHARPRFTAIFRTKNSAAFAAEVVKRPNPTFITLHHCHHDFWVAGADCQTNSASLTGKTAAEFFPSRAPVGALENSADVFTPGHAWTRRETPRRSLPRVKHCINNLRIRRVKCDIATARLCVVRRRCMQDQFPALTRICCFK